MVVNLLVRSELTDLHGASAILTATVVSALIVVGVYRRSRPVRRWAVAVGAGLLGLAVAFTVGAAVAGAQARDSIEDGEEAARRGLRALQGGDTGTAATEFAEAASAFRSASRAADAPWARPARIVPVVAQHQRLLEELSASGASTAATTARAIGAIDFERLRPVAGRVDVDGVRALEEPLVQTEQALSELDLELEDQSSSWLVAPVQDRLDDLRAELADSLGDARRALEVVRVAPTLLGGDGPRRYFVAFTTPSEARGIGGYMGNWAELTVDRGALQLTGAGRTGDLNQGGDPAARVLDGPAEYVDRYGRFGAGQQGEPINEVFWSNVTMSPDFPSVAYVIAQLYPVSGGRPVDGVILADPYAVAALLRLTGPISVPGLDAPLTGDNAAKFLLVDQYVQFGDRAERVELLESATAGLLARLLEANLPALPEIADALAPVVDEGRLLVWSSRPEEADSLDRLAIGGLFSPPEVDGLAVTNTNASGNKIDSFLRRAVRYEGEVDRAAGAVDAVATIRLRNEAPAAGLPSYLIGNSVGDPPGTNRTFVSVYTPLDLVDATLDGQPFTLSSESELGWKVYGAYVVISAQQEAVLELRLRGEVPLDAGYRFVYRPQPLVVADDVQIDVTDGNGHSLVSMAGPAVMVMEGVEVLRLSSPS